jgi:methyl-accepting chemotaxis protein
MHPPVSSKPYRTRTLASVALLVIGLTALALLNMPQLYSHGIELAPSTLSHDTGTWLAALGAPGMLFGLLLHRQSDPVSLGKTLSPPNTADLPPTPDDREVAAALASLERTLLRMAKGELSSGEAAQDIRRLIAGTVAQTGATIARVESLGNVMGDLIATIRQINERMRDIHSASQEQAGGLAQVSQAIMRIDDATQQTSTQVEDAAAATKQLYGQSRGLHHLLQEFDLGSAGANARKIHHDMPPLVRQAAADVGRLWEMAIGKKLLSEEDLFDDAYQPFGDSEPPKYHTRFDSIADKLRPRIQEIFLKAGAHVTYAIACDRNGYVPTHNQRYCQPLTGDPEHDRLHNRSKRLFSDPVGRRCGKHPLPFLLQTYRRDTGEIVHDISAPVYVNGKHWGGFRVGYKTAIDSSNA